MKACRADACTGFLVVAPDYFFGDPVTKHLDTPGFSIDEWIGPKMDAAVPAVPKWIDAVKQRFGTPETKYITVGASLVSRSTCVC